MKGNPIMRNSARFVGLLLVPIISGCPNAVVQPPPPPRTTPDHPNHVTLQVASGGSGYVCTFSGGDDGNGNVKVKRSEGDVNIHVDLNAAANFAILGFYFDHDTDPPQLSGKATGGGSKGVIHDNNSDVLDAYFGVVLKDANASASFVCDPKIVNN